MHLNEDILIAFKRRIIRQGSKIFAMMVDQFYNKLKIRKYN